MPMRTAGIVLALKRFQSFSQYFYHPLVQEPYPLAADQQAVSLLFAEARLQFLALNSAWEIDEYLAPLEGLILAEVEMQSESESPPLPPWIGEDITFDPSFSNAALAQRVESQSRLTPGAGRAARRVP